MRLITIINIRLVCLFAFATSASHATTIVSYTFGTTSATGTTVADVGAAISTLSWNSGGAVGYAESFSSLGATLSVGSFQAGEYYEITLNASGYTAIALSAFRANGTDTAPVSWKMSYSLAGTGGVFVDAANFSIANSTAVGSTTISGFSLPSGADDNASIVLRLIATTSTRVDGTLSAANGTFRIDNISFTGTAIPEPASGAVVTGLGVLSLVIMRRRRAP